MNRQEGNKVFFEELRDSYLKQKHDFVWSWNDILEISQSPNKINTPPEVAVKDFVHYIAYNLSHNILHGPLPHHLHNRMILDSNNTWSKRYVEYLEGRD